MQRPRRNCANKIKYFSPPLSPIRPRLASKKLRGRPRKVESPKYSLRQKNKINYAEDKDDFLFKKSRKGRPTNRKVYIEYSDEEINNENNILSKDDNNKIEDDENLDDKKSKQKTQTYLLRERKPVSYCYTEPSETKVNNFYTTRRNVEQEEDFEEEESQSDEIEEENSENLEEINEEGQRYSLRDRRNVSYGYDDIVRSRQIIERNRISKYTKKRINTVEISEDEVAKMHHYSTRHKRVSFKQFFSNKISAYRTRSTRIYSQSGTVRSTRNLRNKYNNARELRPMYNLRKRDQNSLNRLKIYSQSNFTVDLKASNYDPLKAKKPTSEDETKFREEHVEKKLPSKFNNLPLNINEIINSRSHLSFPKEFLNDENSVESLGLDFVSGLEEQLNIIKETILMPTLYPTISKSYNLSPAKGIIFHGAPGTGKTLTARSLIKECSNELSPIAFFHYNASDILSKWVGNSETRMQEIFEAAKLWEPSIIFIDEIDGLTPKRNTIDRHSASLVASLLSQMDGLDDNGRVILIGATNRLHSMDPALKRSGRFEEILHFPLPNFNTRYSIIKKNVELWPIPPNDELIQYLAQLTSGFCGADLVSLCANASKVALYKRYPNLNYKNNNILIDPNELEITKDDFLSCLHSITPALKHELDLEPKPLEFPLNVLYEERVNNLIECFKSSYGSSLDNLCFHKPTPILLYGDSPITNYNILVNILHKLDDINIAEFGLRNISTSDEGSDLKSLQQTVLNLKKKGGSSVIIIRDMDQLINCCYSELIDYIKNLLNEPVIHNKLFFIFTCTQITNSIQYILNNLNVLSMNIQIPNLNELKILYQQYPKVYQQVNNRDGNILQLRSSLASNDNTILPNLTSDEFLYLNYNQNESNGYDLETILFNEDLNMIFPPENYNNSNWEC